MMFSVDEKLAGLRGDVVPQPVHQGGDLPLPGVVGDEAHQHGVPGETLQTGEDGEMSVEDGVRLDLPQPDGCPLDLLQHVQLADLAVWTCYSGRSGLW